MNALRYQETNHNTTYVEHFLVAYHQSLSVEFRMSAKSSASFKKGTVVKVMPEIKSNGEIKTHWTYVDGVYKDTGDPVCYTIWRDRTEAEYREWLDSPESKGMNCAGETKLDSPTRSRVPSADESFTIVKARVRARFGWSECPGCAEIEDSAGMNWFVQRKHLH